MADRKVLRCIELQESGVVGDDLIKALCSEFSISEFAADWVVKDAVAEARSSDSSEVRGIENHIKLRQRLLDKALADDNDDLALKALQDLGKLTGAYNEVEDKKIEVEFLFPDAISYYPLTRDAINKALEISKREASYGSDGDVDTSK